MELMGKFDKLKSPEGMKISDILAICLRCSTKEEANDLLKEFEGHYDNIKVAHVNLGYIFGYANDKERKKLYSLFPLDHPIFGHLFGRDNNDYEIVDAVIELIKKYSKEKSKRK